MYPIKLQPIFKDIVWGGERLKNDFGYESDLEKIAEAWVLTAREDGDNIIKNGELRGKSFTEYVKENSSVLGSKGVAYKEFPLLIKFIDAKSDLSVQVHPDDEYARIHENSFGKTEAWYILDCNEGAELIYGFKEPISKETFKNSIADNSFLEFVNKVKVHKGDVFFIEAGTLHAIGGGILLAEVQQSCNTTYRVYDYGRTVNGKPRELHVEKALDVTKTIPPVRSGEPDGKPEKCGDAVITALCSCSFFSFSSFSLDGRYIKSVDGESFLSVLILDGRGSITAGNTAISVKKGDSVFIPANSGEVIFSGKFEALFSTL